MTTRRGRTPAERSGAEMQRDAKRSKGREKRPVRRSEDETLRNQRGG